MAFTVHVQKANDIGFRVLNHTKQMEEQYFTSPLPDEHTLHQFDFRIHKHHSANLVPL